MGMMLFAPRPIVMLKALRLTLFATVISLLATGLVFARELRQGENCSVPADAVVRGTLFAFCQNLSIAGRVEGNVIGIGLRATISGEIGKNVYLAGLTLEQSGAIQGDLHYVGLMLHLDAPAAAAAPGRGPGDLCRAFSRLRREYADCRSRHRPRLPSPDQRTGR